MTALPTEYGPLAHELVRRAAAKRQPVSGMMELTSRCNLACRMCYIRQPADSHAEKARELSAAEWLTLVRDAKDNGMVYLLLTGGEVFLRPDLFEIYEPITRFGLILTLFTNGTLITDRVAARLAEAPPSRTEITLYGATAATYESITGVPGSYARCCAGIQALRDRRVPLALKTMITRQNVHELDAMRTMARQWGVSLTVGNLLQRRRDRQPSDVDECRLSPDEIVDMEASDPATAAAWSDAARSGVKPGHTRNFVCYAGKAMFVVSSAGEMSVCMDVGLPAAKPLETGFRAAWQALQAFVDEAPAPSSECQECDDRIFCFRCPSWSYLETGTLTEPPPYVCSIARARKRRYAQSQ